MTTAQTIINQARRDLLAGVTEERNKLSAGVDAVTTTFPFSFDLKGIRAGSVVEGDAELVYVWSTSGANATVERGWEGTTAASHAANAVATVKPRFPTQMLFDHLNDDISDLSSPGNGLFQIKTLERAYNGSDRAINLTGVSDLLDVHEVRWKYLSDDWPEVRRWRLMRDTNTTSFASGHALIIDEPVQASTLRIIYKAPYTRLTTVTQDVTSDAGVQASLEDVLRMGVQLRAMVGREVKRNFTEAQGDTRRAQEVTAGNVQGSWRGIAALRQTRIEAEQARLSKMYPQRIRRY